jgi:Protein of unknown function (DUF3465)
MKKLLLVIAAIAAIYFALGRPGALQKLVGSNPTQTQLVTDGLSAELSSAISDQKSGVQVTGAGTVIKLLADDNEGRRHQRFILTLSSGQTLLVAHNIDLASRINSLQTGDVVEFNGVYEWNVKGGVIHWTHHDPNGHHQAGWLKHAGQTYQ